MAIQIRHTIPNIISVSSGVIRSLEISFSELRSEPKSHASAVVRIVRIVCRGLSLSEIHQMSQWVVDLPALVGLVLPETH